MPLIEPIIRPPAEADSVLLQVTVGCSANHCSFCGAYQNKPFRLISSEQILADIQAAGRAEPSARRVFLLDGDALCVPAAQLSDLLAALAAAFPALSRVSSYANGFSVAQRSDEQLRQLARHKLTLMYIGLESGSQDILTDCGKRSTVEEMITAVRRGSDCGIKSSVMVLLGLGGRRRSDEHVRHTVAALNRMQPRYLSLLSVMLIPGTALWRQARSGAFQPLSVADLLRETHDIIQGLSLSGTVFRSDHASNYLALEGRLPHDKERLLAELSAAMSGQRPLRPEWMRGV